MGSPETKPSTWLDAKSSDKKGCGRPAGMHSWPSHTGNINLWPGAISIYGLINSEPTVNVGIVSTFNLLEGT